MMKSLIDLRNKTILIVGASSGIGRQTAITLSQVGAKLVLTARNEERLQNVLHELEGDGHEIIASDASDLSSIEAVVKRAVSMVGMLDGLVYAAGMEAPIPLNQAKPDRVQQVFDVNFFGFFEYVRQATKKGRFNPGMRIVAISSIASLCGNKSRSIYSSSKAAMDSAVRCMAVELAPKEVCINTVAPAMTATDMFDRYVESNGKDSDGYKRVISRQYLGIAQPDDIANAIAFLVSPAARFITGITMPVDGGYTTC